jgi:hypothetical protein
MQTAAVGPPDINCRPVALGDGYSTDGERQLVQWYYNTLYHPIEHASAKGYGGSRRLLMCSLYALLAHPWVIYSTGSGSGWRVSRCATNSLLCWHSVMQRLRRLGPAVYSLRLCHPLGDVWHQAATARGLTVIAPCRVVPPSVMWSSTVADGSGLKMCSLCALLTPSLGDVGSGTNGRRQTRASRCAHLPLYPR